MWKHRKDKPIRLQALDVVMAFGPERRRPEQERLQEAVPNASVQAVADALAEAHTVEHRAYEVTEACWNGGAMLPSGEFKRLTKEAERTLSREFPDLPQKTIARLINQAHYFHSK
jgi:hypothetical protein